MNNRIHALETQLKQSEKRAHQHWYEDGVVETAVGIYFLLLALLYYVDYAIKGLPISAFGLPLIVIGGVFVLGPIVRRVKARLTYPRTGYVQYKERSAKRRWWAMGIGLVVGFTVGVLVALPSARDFLSGISPNNEFNWLSLAQGVVLALILGLIAIRFQVARYYVLAAIALMAGILLMFVPMADVLATAVYFFVMGMILIIVGLITLRTFLHQTEPHQEEI